MTDWSKYDFSSLEPVREAVPEVPGFVLVEATADAVARYENRKLEGAVLTEDGTIARFTKLADLQPFALALCLYPEDRDHKLEPYTAEELAGWEARIRGWADRVTDPVFARLRQLSPTMFGSMGLEDLTKQRAYIDKQIAALEAKKGDPKGSLAGGSPTSSTAES